MAVLRTVRPHSRVRRGWSVPRDPVGSSALQSPASRAWRARCQRALCRFRRFFHYFGHVWTVTKESW